MEVILYILILCLDQARQKAFDDSYGMYWSKMKARFKWANIYNWRVNKLQSSAKKATSEQLMTDIKK